MNDKGPEGRRIGIDAGSKTIKIVVLDADDAIIYSAYRRHRSNIRDTLRDLIHDVIWINGDMDAYVSVTGSAGIGVSKLLDIPFVQEVVATTEAVKRTIPDADAVVELGGEDAKVVYLTGGVEQRMNATCAGGTGGFIDTIAFMLGVRTSHMSSLAMGAQRIHPIASRCAVFAQTDIRPLLNEGASKADIAASALDAVVRQTLGGLACGRPLQGTVVFLGGPFQYIPELANRFRKALGLDRAHGIKPKDAHLYPALGAAVMGVRSQRGTSPEPRIVRLSQLETLLSDESTVLDADDIPRLEPLFSSEEELAAFRERHGRAVFPTKRAFDAQGPVYLGIDSGSTTVKLALIDAEGNLLHSDYRPSRGETAETIRDMLHSLYQALPSMMLAGQEPPYIAYAVATGYGEGLLMDGFGLDAGVVETTAHVRAARHFCSDATFVLDIGGQDMKALWLNGPHVSDAVLNEACSSGCGAFLEGTAHSLHSSPTSFAGAALKATSPVDLGTRCTVFMSSRVKHAQKVGASLEDIAAGAAYSVIHNALFRIIGADRISDLGERIIVQGGSFKSDAVLRAFEKTCGREVIRPDKAHLMGAIGAALIARDRALQKGLEGKSGVVSRSDLDQMELKRSTKVCEGCQNSCRLTVLHLGSGRTLVSGNRCERGRALVGKPRASLKDQVAQAAPVNLIAWEQEHIEGSRAAESRPISSGEDGSIGSRPQKRKSLSLGILTGLEMYRFTPFWQGFVESLGFEAVLPGRCDDPAMRSKAWETVPAESACYPAKLVHAKAFNLRSAGVDAILFPVFARGNHCAVASGYASALKDGIEWLRDGSLPLLTPCLSSTKPQIWGDDAGDLQQLAGCLGPLCEQAHVPLLPDELTQAVEAGLAAQRRFEEALAQKTDEALTALEADSQARGILLVGRPYHDDPAIMHDIDSMLEDLGFLVFSMIGLEPHLGRMTHRPEGMPEWRPAKRLMKAARFVVDHPRIDLVCLQSFGCGYDAVSLEEVRELLEAHGRPFTALKIDEMVETAHIRIRLRTLAESIASQQGRVTGLDDAPNASQPLPKGGPPEGSQRRIRPLDEPLDETDLAIARTSTIKDVCFSANALAARTIRRLKDDPDCTEVELPGICQQCLCDAIPRMVERATGLAPAFIWTQGGRSCWDNTSKEDASEARSEDTLRPKIGIIGNPLLVFEPYMNDHIVDLLEELGCHAVLPQEEALYTEDVRYLDQLERFARQGVRHVIYLQSFGCVKGHVQARGSHYDFAERFPNMPVTVLDYDPESSALNRENRIRLIAETVLNAEAD